VNTAPSVTITSPASTALWSSGDTIVLAATSSDAEQGSLPDSGLAWQVYREDCVNPDFTGCSETALGAYGGANASFVAPDAAFPAYLRIVLTGTDNGDLVATNEVSIYPLTADVTLASVPPGLALSFDGGAASVAQSAHTVIVNAGFLVAAPSPQMLGATQYQYQSWSDGGDASHVAHIGAAGTASLSASFAAPADIALIIDDGAAVVNTGQHHSWSITISNDGVNALAGVVVQSTASAGLDQLSWTCSASAGSSCASSGSGNIDESAQIASGGSVTYVIDAYVRTDAGATVTVAGSAQVPAGYLDASPANDSASDVDAVNFDLIFRDGFDASP
jgi:uncharacterized repeat protein (TIGR01451 family)